MLGENWFTVAVNSVTDNILYDAMSEMPQKGNTAEECQKVSLICAINDLEAKLNGVCIDDFLINDK